MKGLNRELGHYQFPPSPASIEEKTAQYTKGSGGRGILLPSPTPKNGLGKLVFPPPPLQCHPNVLNVTH